MNEPTIRAKEERDRPTWKLLAWWGAGFAVGVIVFGGFALYAQHGGAT